MARHFPVALDLCEADKVSLKPFQILFLDIDGVLNSEQSAIYCNELGFKNGGLTRSNGKFCPIATSNLRELLRNLPDLRIVISSTWRMGESIESLRELMLSYAGIPGDLIIGATPSTCKERGHDIQKWLDITTGKINVQRFAILDDASDMVHLTPHLIQTSWREGFMRSKYLELYDYFLYPWKVSAGMYWGEATQHGKIKQVVTATNFLQEVFTYALPEVDPDIPMVIGLEDFWKWEPLLEEVAVMKRVEKPETSKGRKYGVFKKFNFSEK